MKKSHLFVAVTASLLGVALAAVAWAQVAGPQVAAARMQGPVAVALVDVNYIFKNHARFKLRMEQFRQDVTAAETAAKQQSEQVRKLGEKLQDSGFRQGSQEYKQMEEEIVKRRSELAANVEMQRRQFTQAEAKIYYDTYQEIMQEVSSYCETNGIPLALKFEHEAINAENPDEIVHGIQRPVVFHSSQLDITPAILERVGRAPTAQHTSPAGVRW